MTSIDLTPFGFTPTESAAYAALLRQGPSTGYALAQAMRLARANAYGALEGLVTRGAAQRAPGERPARYRPADPQALLVELAARQGEALDRLSRSLKDATRPQEPATRFVAGERAVANLVQQLVARAAREVRGVLASELWRSTLPAWRRAAGRATLEIRTAGEPVDDEGLTRGTVAGDSPTLLLIDAAQVLTAAGSAEQITALWSSHPLIVTLAAAALRAE